MFFRCQVQLIRRRRISKSYPSIDLQRAVVISFFLPSELRVASPVNVPPLTVLSRPTLL